MKIQGIVRHDQRSEACVWTSEFDAWVSASDACAAASLTWDDACELASLECYYHNVSNWTQDAYGLFAFTGYGEKKIWIEYDGIVRVGINAGSVKISNPDKDDVITVTMPAAKVLDKDLDESTIKEITKSDFIEKV